MPESIAACQLHAEYARWTSLRQRYRLKRPDEGILSESSPQSIANPGMH